MKPVASSMPSTLAHAALLCGNCSFNLQGLFGTFIQESQAHGTALRYLLVAETCRVTNCFRMRSHRPAGGALEQVNAIAIHLTSTCNKLIFPDVRQKGQKEIPLRRKVSLLEQAVMEN